MILMVPCVCVCLTFVWSGVWYTIGAIANVTILVTLPTLGTWSIGPYKSFARKYGFLPSKGRSMSIVPGSPALVSRANNVDDWELLDVLTDPVALDSFTEHLASEFSVENIMFWLHAGEFEVACHREVENDRAGDDSGHTSFNHKHMLLRAQWLVDTYLLDTAPLMVNVSSDQREAVQVSVMKWREAWRDAGSRSSDRCCGVGVPLRSEL